MSRMFRVPLSILLLSLADLAWAEDSSPFDGFWVLDRYAIVLIFMEILDTGRAYIHHDGCKVAVGVRTADGSRGVYKGPSIHVTRRPELVNVQEDVFIYRHVDQRA